MTAVVSRRSPTREELDARVIVLVRHNPTKAEEGIASVQVHAALIAQLEIDRDNPFAGVYDVERGRGERGRGGCLSHDDWHRTTARRREEHREH
jgi:hypothetical protein